MNESISSRNTAAFWQAITLAAQKMDAQQARVDGLVATLGGLLERVTAMERMVMSHKATSAGHGPTVK